MGGNYALNLAIKLSLDLVEWEKSEGNKYASLLNEAVACSIRTKQEEENVSFV